MFNNLLDELEALKKSTSTSVDDDKKIQAAANGDVDKDGTPDGSDPDTKGDDDDDNQEMMGKSFTAMIDGEEVEAFDGMQIIKSLGSRLDDTNASMQKALMLSVQTMQSQGELIKSQGAQIAVLREDLTRIGGQGRDRKSTVSVLEKSIGIKQEEKTGMTPKVFMAKALQCQKDGKLSGADVTRAEAYLNDGLQIPEYIRDVVANA